MEGTKDLECLDYRVTTVTRPPQEGGSGDGSHIKHLVTITTEVLHVWFPTDCRSSGDQEDHRRRDIGVVDRDTSPVSSGVNTRGRTPTPILVTGDPGSLRYLEETFIFNGSTNPSLSSVSNRE